MTREMINRIVHRSIPSWTRWIVFAVFIIVGGFWFSGYPESAYDDIQIVELSEYCEGIIADNGR